MYNVHTQSLIPFAHSTVNYRYLYNVHMFSTLSVIPFALSSVNSAINCKVHTMSVITFAHTTVNSIVLVHMLSVITLTHTTGNDFTNCVQSVNHFCSNYCVTSCTMYNCTYIHSLFTTFAHSTAITVVLLNQKERSFLLHSFIKNVKEPKDHSILL